MVKRKEPTPLNIYRFDGPGKWVFFCFPSYLSLRQLLRANSVADHIHYFFHSMRDANLILINSLCRWEKFLFCGWEDFRVER